MVFAVFNLMALPSTVSAHTVFVLVVTISAVVLAVVRPATVIAPISTMPIASAVAASPPAVVVLAVILAIVTILATIVIAMIAVLIAAGVSDQCIGLPTNTECPLSFCKQFESLVKSDSGLVHSDQHYHIIIVGR